MATFRLPYVGRPLLGIYLKYEICLPHLKCKGVIDLVPQNLKLAASGSITHQRSKGRPSDRIYGNCRCHGDKRLVRHLRRTSISQLSFLVMHAQLFWLVRPWRSSGLIRKVFLVTSLAHRNAIASGPNAHRANTLYCSVGVPMEK